MTPAALVDQARDLALLLVPCRTKDLLNDQAAAIESLVAERESMEQECRMRQTQLAVVVAERDALREALADALKYTYREDAARREEQ